MVSVASATNEKTARFLAAAGDVGPTSMDYSVLSVAVMTLGLILVVEVARHRLDHIALQKPFFQAVLQQVYAELSTLGVVEFFIWLLHSYYDGLNVPKEQVFAKVHFTLFYTAIFNAVQSVLLAFSVRRLSRRHWVQTESLQLSHYVEIREEFAKCDQNVSRRRYNDLLLQIRFHELRVHFLQSYQLPLRMKISDYLIKSENAVLVRLVSVSTTAWLLLTASVNLLYYVLGVMAMQRRDASVIATALTAVFFVALSLFCVVAFLVYHKMRHIFRHLMHTPRLWQLTNTQLQDDKEEDQLLKQEQLSLFWGSDPRLVIAAIQFMQFGYAVALAVVIIFWDAIDDGVVPMQAYIFCILAFYGLFLLVTAQTIPRYTLCTSLGQLVDSRRLSEALAEFQLEEEKQKRLDDLEFQKYVLNEERSTGQASLAGASTAATSSDSVPTSATTLRPKTIPRQSSKLSLSVNKATIMADLVKLDTHALRDNLPEKELDQLAQREARRERRRHRHKSVSDGVALMASLTSSSVDQSVRRDSLRGDSLRATQTDRIPLTIQDDSALPSIRRSGSNESLSILTTDRDTLLSATDTQPESLQRRRSRRRGRLKTMSDGVAAMATLRTTQTELDAARLPWYAAGSQGSVRSGNTGGASSLRPIVEGPHGEHANHEDTTFHDENLEGATDDLSIQSNASDGTSSEVSAVPEVDKTLMVSTFQDIVDSHLSLRGRAREYYMSSRFLVMSNIFGTMVAFYYVGQRVERFLNTDGIINPDTFISFDFEENYTFWLLTCWLLMFLITDAAILWSFGRYETLQRTRERKLYAAAIIDVIIAGGCLTCLFIGEVQRCCADDYFERSLAGAEKEAGPAPCDCPAFGGRTYGGLGNVEPYVSLITLRLFRFFVAKRIVMRLKWNEVEDLNGSSHHSKVIDTDRPYPSEHPLCTVDPDDNHHHDHPNKKGMAVELWQDAVARHPAIVAKYGAFSSEMLQTMLGIPIVDSNLPSKGPKISSKEGEDIYTVDKQYKALLIEAQEIILQGKLGKNVCCVDDSIRYGATTINEHSVAPQLSTRALKFHVDESAPTTLAEEAAMFASPNARLVRSMRRCDRKLIPILDKWTAVDVVMTRFEIIYFDATAIDDGPDRPTNAVATHQALEATKGGKGLRLCDVLAGRKVVGKILLADVASVHVERDLVGALLDDSAPDEELQKNEYWQSSSLGVHVPRKAGWLRIKQDRLKIATIHGHTLYLRFYSDLDDCEKHMGRMEAETEESGPIYKNFAFQWAQTVARFCGPSQLQQDLPHFGADNDEELRDYLVVQSPEDRVPNQRRIHRMSIVRSSSRMNLAALGAEEARAGTERASSLGNPGQDSPKRPKKHRRAKSHGEAFNLSSEEKHDSLSDAEGGRARRAGRKRVDDPGSASTMAEPK